METTRLRMYGGALGGSVPLILFIVGMVWITFAGSGGMTTFWAVAWLAVFIGFFFAKKKGDYAESLIRGVGNSNGAVVITLYFFAGVFGEILTGGGLIEGLLWLGIEANVTGQWFALLALICSMLFSLATGSSVGTAAAMTPVLYPAGVMLGSDPTMLAVAILAGAGFGDNVSPHSDTTIASAATQGAKIKDVVAARMPMVIIAAVLTMIVIFLTGGGGEITAQDTPGVETDPMGLIMLLSFVVLIVAVMLNRHMLEAFVWGILTAVVLGLVTGGFQLGAVFHVPQESGESSGLVEDGIASVGNTMIFVLIILALSQIMVESGAIEKLLNFTSKFVRGQRSAELAIIGVTTAVSIPISHNTAAALVVGPGFVNRIGQRYNLSPSRRAIMMDCSVTSLYFTIPWHSSVITWYGLLVQSSQQWGLALPSVLSSFLNPYAWFLFAVIVIAAITGWRRNHGRDANVNEQVDLVKS